MATSSSSFLRGPIIRRLWMAFMVLAAMAVGLMAAEPSNDEITKSDPPGDKERLGKARQTVVQMFATDFEQATSATKRQKLVRELLENAPRIKDDVEVRYAMLIEARDQAVAAGRVDLTEEAIDLLTKYYRLDPIALKTDALEQLSKKTRDAAVHRQIVSTAVSLAKSVAEDRRFDEANRLVLIALVSARKTKNAALIQQVNTTMLDIAAVKKRQKNK
jgi:hypothetical protein